jgi:hypothetical protein
MHTPSTEDAGAIETRHHGIGLKVPWLKHVLVDESRLLAGRGVRWWCGCAGILDVCWQVLSTLGGRNSADGVSAELKGWQSGGHQPVTAPSGAPARHHKCASHLPGRECLPWTLHVAKAYCGRTATVLSRHGALPDQQTGCRRW